jgi:uncharacterized protein (TIGR02117 family)
MNVQSFKNVLLQCSKWILWSVLAILTAILLLLITSYVCMKIPVKGEDVRTATGDSIVIYLSASLVHSDFILPMRNDIMDWSSVAQPYQPSDTPNACDYVKVGWGDKQFFVNTPNWSDLTASTALGAAFGLHESALHFQLIKMDTAPKEVVRINVSNQVYRKLVDYILQSMRVVDGRLAKIPFAYSDNDCFYESVHNYSMLNTCNTWMNAGLKESELPACLWTILGTGIMEKYENE